MGMNRKGAGCRVQGAGCKVQGAGYKVQGAGYKVQGTRYKVKGENQVYMVAKEAPALYMIFKKTKIPNKS